MIYSVLSICTEQQRDPDHLFLTLSSIMFHHNRLGMVCPGNCFKYLVIAYNRKDSEREYIYIYICQNIYVRTYKWEYICILNHWIFLLHTWNVKNQLYFKQIKYLLCCIMVMIISEKDEPERHRHVVQGPATAKKSLPSSRAQPAGPLCHPEHPEQCV